VVVIPTFLGIVAFSLTDFQGYPDLYPLLPYAALGVGGAVALAAAQIRVPRLRQVAAALSVAAVALLVGLTWSSYTDSYERSLPLPTLRDDAARLDRILDPGETLYALGDPTPLVLTRRRNPSRYIYLRSGVDRWVIRHTRGGLAGWEAQIRASGAEIVTVGAWGTGIAHKIKRYLKSIYGPPSRLGPWTVFVKPAVRERAARRGISL
jgi:hypothetical protein